jgi:SAM-dependent methyltransferase
MQIVQSRGVVSTALFAALWLVCAAGTAQTRAECEAVYKPATGQPGKDVIWVPTNDALVERMLKMANVTSSDLVYDLGAGDGKIAIAAAKKFGATSVGVEYDPDMARFAQCLVKAEGVSAKTKVIQGDIFETDFTAATGIESAIASHDLENEAGYARRFALLPHG